jgi:hypothetical protein
MLTPPPSASSLFARQAKSRHPSFRASAGAALLCVCTALPLPGCATKLAHDPLADLRNPKLSDTQRRNAIHESWQEVEQGEVDRSLVREELKTMAWSGGWPTALRVEALQTVLNDPEPASAANNHELVRLMLPREQDHEVVTLLANTAVKNGWTDVTPALVRSLSRPWPDVPDAQRPERIAIEKLNPGRPVERLVYDMFLFPPEDGSTLGAMSAERIRVDCWDLLGRLDVTGARRAEMLLDPQAPASGPVMDMRASLVELRCLPITGEELRWLTSLHSQNDIEAMKWWRQVSSVVGGLDQAKVARLQLRHLEPIRWASVHQPQWLQQSRDQLLTELRTRLKGRKVYRRTADSHEKWTPAPEGLADNEAKLTWADLISILVLDDALHDPNVARALFAQTEMDREDRTAEYGGLIKAAPDVAPVGTPPWNAVLYPPRPGNRRGDREFVASSDMISQGDRATAHYHFHVQERRNSDYAGPSHGDMNYAARMGRTCLVFTSVDSDALDADLYQPDGVVLDLGVIKLPPEGAATGR